MKPFKAIAAMSENRVIGQGNRLPWHLPEDFKWFKKTTTGHILLMGRKTFESLGKPLPERTTIVLSRSGFAYPGVRVVQSVAELDFSDEAREIFVCGGAQIYAELLPQCSDLYLSVVKGIYTGDAFFPRFEDQFERVGELLVRPEFSVLHYRRA